MKESTNIDKFIGPCGLIEKTEEHKGGSKTHFTWCAWDGLGRLKKIEGRGNLQNRDPPDHNIVKITKKADKSPGDLRNLQPL